MSNLRKIGNKLFDKKIELKSHEVELGISQDLEKSLNKHKQQRKNIDNGLDSWYSDLFKVRDRFAKIEGEYRSFNSSISDLKKYIEEAEAMAKDIGISPSAIPNYNESKALINTSEDIDDAYKDGKKLESKIG